MVLHGFGEDEVGLFTSLQQLHHLARNCAVPHIWPAVVLRAERLYIYEMVESKSRVNEIPLVEAGRIGVHADGRIAQLLQVSGDGGCTMSCQHAIWVELMDPEQFRPKCCQEGKLCTHGIGPPCGNPYLPVRISLRPHGVEPLVDRWGHVIDPLPHVEKRFTLYRHQVR